MKGSVQFINPSNSKHIVNARPLFSIGDFSGQLFNNYNTDGDVLEVGLFGSILFMPEDYCSTDPAH